MKRKLIGVALVCSLVFAAILAGYWDMLNAEKLKIVRDKATDAVAEIADIVRSDPARAPAPAAPATPAASPLAAAGTGVPARTESDGTPESASTTAATAPPSPMPPAPPTARPTPPDAVAETAGHDAAQKGAAAAPPPPPGDADMAASAPAASDASAPPVGEPAPPPVPAAAPAKGEGTAPPPTFDILRVEPDGSTVLAGKAPPGAAVSLRDGAATIGAETANAAGEFVIVLDDRLTVGDHQIRIEAKMPDGLTVLSKETAIVSIPEAGRESELLAMVEAPDEASRLITLPAAPDTPKPPKPPEPTLPAATAGDGPPGATPPSLPPTSAEAAADPAPSGATGEAKAPPAPSQAEAEAAPAPPVAAAERSLAVEAVEIEDRTIYIAGRASIGAAVRLYVDNAFLAEDRTLTGERFLVTAKADVSAGEHTVRADALDAAGTVVARVEVPFLKPDGRTMSAISPAEPAAAEAEGTADTAGTTPETRSETVPTPPAGSAEIAEAVPASPGSTAAPLAEAAASAPTSPAAPSAAAAADRTDPALEERMAVNEPPAIETIPPPGAPPAEKPVAAEPADLPPATPEPVPPAIAPAASPGSAEPTASASLAAADRSAAPEASAPVAAAPAKPDAMTQEATVSGGAPLSDGVAAEVAVTRQPALEGVGSRVIIRRGDTLWRISRDTYGLGARYTTIYLANGDQIRDPNRIYPGQVFRVPEEAPSPGTEPRL